MRKQRANETKLMGGTTMRCVQSAYNQTIDLNTKVWLLMIVVSLSLVFRPYYIKVKGEMIIL